MMIIASLILILVAIILFLIGILLFVSGRKKGDKDVVLSSEVTAEQVNTEPSVLNDECEPDNGNGVASEDEIADDTEHHMVPDIIDTTPCAEGGIDIDFWKMVENFDSLDVETKQYVATRLAAAGFFRKEKANELIMANHPAGSFGIDGLNDNSTNEGEKESNSNGTSSAVPPSLNGILTKPEEKPDNNSKNNDSEDNDGFPDPTEAPSYNIAEEFPEEDEERRRLVEEFDN